MKVLLLATLVLALETGANAACSPALGMTETQLIAACGAPPTPARLSSGMMVYLYPGIRLILQPRNGGEMTVTNMQLMAGEQ
jgi:hypothetical protein